MQSSIQTPEQKMPARLILTAWLIAGTLDLSLALIVAYLRNKILPEQILKYIASALFGQEAFAGGMGMILAGFFMHYAIALFWTVTFFILYHKFGFYLVNKFLLAVLYGAFVWFMMNVIILPLTQVTRGPFTLTGILIGSSILMVAIGLPLSLIAHRYFSVERKQSL